MDAVELSRLSFSSKVRINLSFDGLDRVNVIYNVLRSKNPQLGKNFLIFATFLRHVAPNFFDSFLDMIEGVIEVEKEIRKEKIAVLRGSFSFKLDFKVMIVEKDIREKDSFTGLSLKLSLDFKAEVSRVKEVDPMVLDMKGNGIKLTGFSDPVLFDIDGDGIEERVSFVEGDDAFLFLDLNMNRFLDGGWELVGNNGGWSNGFEVLKAFDFNRDGKIDLDDLVYHLSYIFQDLNKNRMSEVSEHRSLFEANITEIDLRYKQSSIKLNKTDRLIAISSYKSVSNTSFKVGNVILSHIE